MSTDHRAVLIIAGGSGTRLWPMSRKALPKQFQPLFGKETPFQLMIRLVSQVVPAEHIFIMAIPEFTEIILKQAPSLSRENILFEPAMRDTGPAVTLGVLQVAERDPEATVAAMWSDHLILNDQEFENVLNAAFEAAETKPDYLVTVGSKPTKPDPTLGYIHMGKVAGTFAGVDVHYVQEFKEKPDQKTAERFFSSWEYFWNVGYNVIKAQTFIGELNAAKPELAPLIATLQENIRSGDQQAIAQAYEEFPRISIDYLLIQGLSKLMVVPADMGWSDIGTWATLHEMMTLKYGNDLIKQGEVQSVGTTNSLVFAKDRPIALVGVSDIVVVDTGDVVLVMDRKASAADLKSLVQEAISETNPELL